MNEAYLNEIQVVLWCGTLSHCHFWTTKIRYAISSQILIPLAKMHILLIQ